MNYLRDKLRFMMAEIGGGGRLPSDYQEVEYIGTTNHEQNYIYTGVVGDNDVGIKCVMEFNEYSTNRWTGGAMLNNSTRIGTPIAYATDRILFNWRSYNIMSGVLNLNTPYEIKVNYLNNRNISVDEEDYMTNIQNIGQSCDICLFTMNNNNTPYDVANTKIYTYQLTKGTEIVRDMIPCYRKSDGEIGMYDLVSEEFFTNDGTGQFIKGADV